jgi:hypothetical protein
MKNILIITLIAQIIFSCKKTELSPQEQLSNTFWTGFFNYELKKNASTTLELIQPFALEFLPNGNINWFETLGNSDGKWVLSDQTITITQENKNTITLSYVDGKIGFLKMVGPPAKWSATSIEKYNPETDKPKSNTVWEGIGLTTLSLIEVNSNPRLNLGSYKDVPIEVKNNLITANSGGLGQNARAFMIIRNDKMYVISNYSGSLISLNYAKK